MSEIKVIGVQIANAQEVCDSISDLICWWAGFKTGVKMSGQDYELIFGQNGIDTCIDLIENIKKEIKRQTT
jgi:hypothetical protein